MKHDCTFYLVCRVTHNVQIPTSPIYAAVETVQLEGSLPVLAPGHAQTVDRGLLARLVHQAAAIVPHTGMHRQDQVPAQNVPVSHQYGELIRTAIFNLVNQLLTNAPSFAQETLISTILVIVELAQQERNQNQID